MSLRKIKKLFELLGDVEISYPSSINLASYPEHLGKSKKIRKNRLTSRQKIVAEATLSQTLTNFNMDTFVGYYLKTLKKEYDGELPEQLTEHVHEEIEDNDSYLQEFEQEMGFPYEDMDYSSEDKDSNYIKFESSKLFKKIIKNYLETSLNYTLPDLIKLASQPAITIYRLLRYHSTTQYFKKHMTTEPEEDYVNHLAKYRGRLGIYWTATKDAVATLADSITAGEDLDEDYYLFEADISNSHINWYDTLYQRVHVEYGDWQRWKPEREIRLFKNTPIKLKSISQYNGDSNEFIPIDISKINNKTFYA